MILIGEVQSPANTPDGRVILHFYAPGQDQPYELSLTREAAADAVPCLLAAIGNLPPASPKERAIGVLVEGEVEIAPFRDGGLVGVSIYGIELGIPVSKPELLSLQAQITDTLKHDEHER